MIDPVQDVGQGLTRTDTRWAGDMFDVKKTGNFACERLCKVTFHANHLSTPRRIHQITGEITGTGNAALQEPFGRVFSKGIAGVRIRASFAAMRQTRSATPAMPHLCLAALRADMRAGHMPERKTTGTACQKVRLNGPRRPRLADIVPLGAIVLRRIGCLMIFRATTITAMVSQPALFRAWPSLGETTWTSAR